MGPHQGRDGRRLEVRLEPFDLKREVDALQAGKGAEQGAEHGGRRMTQGERPHGIGSKVEQPGDMGMMPGAPQDKGAPRTKGHQRVEGHRRGMVARASDATALNA